MFGLFKKKSKPEQKLIPEQESMPEPKPMPESQPQEEEKPKIKHEPTFFVFASSSDRAMATAMFGNVASYYTPEFCIEKVRSNFNLPSSLPVVYVSQSEWRGPKPIQNGNSFQMDMDEANVMQMMYLVEKCNYDQRSAAVAIMQGRAMQLPNLGLLWICVYMN